MAANTIEARVVYPVELQSLEPAHTAAVRYRARLTEIGSGIAAAYSEIGAYLRDRGIEHGATKTYLRVMPEGDEGLVEAGVTVTSPIEAAGRVEPGTLPGGQAAVALHIGPYTGLPAAYAAIRTWLVTNDCTSAGYPWEVYLNDPQQVAPEALQTEVVWPIVQSGR